MTDYDVTPPPNRLADRVQLRTRFSIEDGDVSRFVTQLEYWLDGDWRVVVRYDHDLDAEGGHDITEEGLHRDVYRDGEKYRVERVTGPIPASEGFDAAEGDLRGGTPNGTSRGSRHGTESEGGATCERRRVRIDAWEDQATLRPGPRPAGRDARTGILQRMSWDPPEKRERGEPCAHVREITEEDRELFEVVA